MNDDQQIVLWMGVLLLGLVIFTTYKNVISTILFDTPLAPSTNSSPTTAVPVGPNFDPGPTGTSLIQPGNPNIKTAYTYQTAVLASQQSDSGTVGAVRYF